MYVGPSPSNGMCALCNAYHREKEATTTEMVTDEEMEKPTTKKKKTSEGLCVHTYETHVYTTFFA